MFGSTYMRAVCVGTQHLCAHDVYKRTVLVGTYFVSWALPPAPFKNGIKPFHGTCRHVVLVVVQYLSCVQHLYARVFYRRACVNSINRLCAAKPVDEGLDAFQRRVGLNMQLNLTTLHTCIGTCIRICTRTCTCTCTCTHVCT